MWSKFFDENGPLRQGLVPELELDAEERSQWQSATCIASSVTGVAAQSTAAAQRYERLHELEGKYPEWLLLAALSAEVHYLLNDTHGAYERLQRVQDCLGLGADGTLDLAVAALSEELEEQEGEEDGCVDEGWTVLQYARPLSFSGGVLCPWDAEETLGRWRALKAARTEAIAVAEWGRHAAISTNVLEGVFSLEGKSESLLVKRGFLVDCIEGIPAESGIKSAEKIIDVLNNTHSCLQHIDLEASAFTQETMKRMHEVLMRGHNLNCEEDEDGSCFASLVPCGTYRRVPCFTQHPSRSIETRFCPWREVPAEMQWYVEHAQQVLADDSADPFLSCAWLQRSFLRVHPFADGNGRVSRIISSIPLLKCGLPPVVVTSERKDKYFAAFIEADKTGDLLPLATFLKEELDIALDYLSKLDDSS